MLQLNVPKPPMTNRLRKIIGGESLRTIGQLYRQCRGRTGRTVHITGGAHGTAGEVTHTNVGGQWKGMRPLIGTGAYHNIGGEYGTAPSIGVGHGHGIA